MKMNKLLMTLLATTIILGACEESEGPTETASEETEAPDETTGTVEEETETDEDSPQQQAGDVIEEDELTRTIIATNYGMNETQENGPFSLTLNNAQLSHVLIHDEDLADMMGGDDLVLVSIQLEVSNNSEDTNIIYPDQGTIVTNTGNQVDADFWFSDSLGGDFLGEVTKSGDVFFFFEGTPEEISTIRYIVGSGHDEDWENFGDDIEFSFDF